jgi:hypothetical protein
MKRVAILALLLGLTFAPLLGAADGSAEKGSACCAKGAGTQRTVTNLDNGVKVEMTSADPKVVAMIQQDAGSCPKPGCCKDCPMVAKGVTRTVDKTDKGVVITATATDAKLVASLQQHAAAKGAAGCAHTSAKACCKDKAKGAGHDCPHAGSTESTKS